MVISLGLKGRTDATVDKASTAAAMGSGLLPVFATPRMAALMENAASNSLLPFLEEGTGTVGISLNLSHTAATPLGMHVWAESEVVAIDGKRITFTVQAYDGVGPIGSATHERFIITNEHFMAKAEARKESL